MLHQNGIGSNVDDIFKYYKDADALIAVSLYEGLPVVICEAMLSGCFVIASDVCDHPRLIGEELEGSYATQIHLSLFVTLLKNLIK